MFIAVIVCTDSYGGIGKDQTIPWQNKADMRHFKQETTKHGSKSVVIMGRITADSLGPNKLPGRTIAVVSRNPQHGQYESVEAALAYYEAQGYEAAYVAGGTEIYTSFMDTTHRPHVLLVSLLQDGVDYHCNRFFRFDAERYTTPKMYKQLEGVTVHLYYRLSTSKVKDHN
jgi:dihydrofolate reductase